MSDANNMSALDIARRLAELGQTQETAKAYTLALGTLKGSDPAGEMECALNILQMGGNYLVAYDALRDLYGRGEFTEDCLSVMTQAFYTPNEKLLKSRYEKNCKLLSKYPYLFRKDFPAFEELPIRFYPYDDNRHLPFHVKDGQFGELIEPNETVISRNFFRDLSKPVLASDVFSMYELEYLNDNVRKSEWVGYENHIYLHYTDWTAFCSYLQILNLRELLKDEKIVFLMDDEISRYPIDFKAEFGKDYSQYPLKPVEPNEITRLIWHTQLSAHNGGDFFNEIFDYHPNLLMMHSVIFDNIEELLERLREGIKAGKHLTIQADGVGEFRLQRLVSLVSKVKNGERADKELLAAIMMSLSETNHLDPTSRITPAVFFQPHFYNLHYGLIGDSQSNRVIMDCREYDSIVGSPVFKAFKYIKTFTPMRRPTTSVGATVRFMLRYRENTGRMVSDVIDNRLCNQSYMVDREERLFKDSVVVRFEDGKLNPKATFSALAAFLDLPYTESMTYCSEHGVRDAETFEGNDIGFSTGAVYRTYDEFLGDPERCYLEFFLRDTYKYYGYDFQYYDGTPMDLERVTKLTEKFDVTNAKYVERIQNLDSYCIDGKDFEREAVSEEVRAQIAEAVLVQYAEARRATADILLRNMRFVNKKGRPLKMTPLLQLDPELLENPLYR